MNLRLFVPLILLLAIAGVASAASPVLNAVGDKSVDEGDLFEFTVTANDADLDNLTLSATGLPTGASFPTEEGTNGIVSQTFNWTPTYDQAGEHDVTFTASDGTNTGSETITITVNNVNRPPAITSTAITTAKPGFAYTYDVDANDQDGDTVTFSLAKSPSTMTINTQTGVISWTPKAIGDFEVVVRAGDGIDSSEQNFTIDVPTKLHIERVEVTVDDGSKETVDPGEKVDEVKPESKVKFEIKVENLFSNSDDVKIKDIVVSVEIKEIEDGEDDIEEESSEFDLDTEDDREVTISFNIPLTVDAKAHDVIIMVKGEDENDIKHSEEFFLELEVEKRSHDVKVRDMAFSPSTVNCGESTTLEIEIINFGGDDESDVEIEIKNPLGDDQRETDIELGNDLAQEPEDARYSASFDIEIPEGKKGEFSFEIRVYRDEDVLEDVNRIALAVNCEEEQPEEEAEQVRPGETARLSKESPLTINIKGESHTLSVTDIEENRANFIFSSTPVAFSLTKNQNKRIDADSDGKDDLLITLLDIENSVASVFLQEIVRGSEQQTMSVSGGAAITGSAVVPVEGEKITGIPEEKEKVSAALITMIILDIVLILVVLYLIMKFVVKKR